MTPAETVQAILDEMGRAVMADDWALFLAHVALPFTLQTGAACLVVEREADMRLAFDQFRDMLRGLRVTDYVRLVDAARLVGPRRIEGSYVTHLVSRGQRVVRPFSSTMTLDGAEGRWLVTRIDTEVLNTRWPIGIPTPPPYIGPEPPAGSSRDPEES